MMRRVGQSGGSRTSGVGVSFRGPHPWTVPARREQDSWQARACRGERPLPLSLLPVLAAIEQGILQDCGRDVPVERRAATAEILDVRSCVVHRCAPSRLGCQIGVQVVDSRVPTGSQPIVPACSRFILSLRGPCGSPTGTWLVLGIQLPIRLVGRGARVPVVPARLRPSRQAMRRYGSRRSDEVASRLEPKSRIDPGVARFALRGHDRRLTTCVRSAPRGRRRCRRVPFDGEVAGVSRKRSQLSTCSIRLAIFPIAWTPIGSPLSARLPGAGRQGGCSAEQEPADGRDDAQRGQHGSGDDALGVDPVPWRPILLARRRRSPRCRSRDRRTRRQSDSRWSSWFGPDVNRESWLGSSSRRPRRSASGSRRLIATLASAPTD